MSKITTQEALKKISLLSNKIHDITKTSNKGLVGHFIEKSIGLTLNSDCLDLEDGEIKAFPLKKNKTQEQLSAKETIAITMTNRENLKTECYAESRLCKKINKIIFVPYFRKNNHVLIFNPILLEVKDDLYTKIKKDYEDIQKTLLEINEIRSKIGDLIQSRTKGAKNTKTRAYYFKTKFVKEYLIPKIDFSICNNLIKQITI